uniref:Secreted protein n=1 Tax=Caenorhabditis tropicalis TaxID=1561998 RepID=A0A1I7V010_9PELO
MNRFLLFVAFLGVTVLGNSSVDGEVDSEIVRFTHRPTPFHSRGSTGKPQELGHFTKGNENNHPKVTPSPRNLFHKFSPGSFTYKWTVAPPFRRTFAPIELIASKKPHSHGTKTPPVVVSHSTKVTHPQQNDIYSWAPIDLIHVSNKPHSTKIPHVKPTSQSH